MLKTDDLSEIKGQFLASLNHEIRTPLSGILGMTDLLLETRLDDEQKEYVNSTRVCAENLLEILNITLEFSALAANHVHLEETEFSLRETLKGAITEFTPKAESKGLRVTCSLDSSLPDAAVGDAVRLRRLLWHLLSNAIKFTGQGKVELAASLGPCSGDTMPVTIAVRDTGIGIAPDQVRLIFEGFRQLESGLARNYGGLGLGLAVCQKLASLLNASITVESELGRGSTFFLHLPLRVPSEGTLAAGVKQTKGRVLVVDDNSVAQTITSHVLRRRAYDVECAGDGLAALEIAARSKFDLILLDLQMPGLDGFETAEQLRKLPAYASTPIVAVTANCSSDYRNRCLRSGMQGFLSKPVRTKELVQAVEKYFARL